MAIQSLNTALEKTLREDLLWEGTDIDDAMLHCDDYIVTTGVDDNQEQFYIFSERDEFGFNRFTLDIEEGSEYFALAHQLYAEATVSATQIL